MNAKLTLRLDKEIIRKAKRIAWSKGISLSRLVEDYFKLVVVPVQSRVRETPVLHEIAGVVSGRTKTVKAQTEYRKHLAEKYR